METEAEKIFDKESLLTELKSILGDLDSPAIEESNSARGRFIRLRDEIDSNWEREKMPSDILALYEDVEEKIEAMSEDRSIARQEASA